MKIRNSQNKKAGYRKTIPYTVRLAIVGIITILLLISLFSVYSAYQTPTTKTINTPILSFEHRGRFDYTLFLHNNTLYDNKSYLRPGEGPFFTQLIRNINVSFTYTFQINHNATINGNYTVDAILQTNVWEKTYPLISKTSFTAQGKQASLTIQFPADYVFYDEILKKINDETRVTAQNPLVRFQTNIIISAQTTNQTITRVFSPSIDMFLALRTIDFSPVLSSTQPGTITESLTIDQPEVITQRNTWTYSSVLLFITLPVILFMTTSTKKTQTKTEKQIRKIRKKYGEWIVETQTRPGQQNTNVIMVKSLEDLTKVGEELGKPILLYTSTSTNEYDFYVLEDHMMYQYELKEE